MLYISYKTMRGSRGGTGGPDPPPPWDLSEVGSCMEVWWVREGVQRLFLSFYYNFFLARFARQYYTYKIQQRLKTPNHFQVQRFILSARSLYTRSLVFMFISPKITQFYSFQTKNFLGEDPQTPHPSTVSSLTHYTMLQLLFSKTLCLQIDSTS